MRITVDPHRFVGMPLRATSLAPDDYGITIDIDGMRVGRILRQSKSSRSHVWLWTVTGPALVQAGIESSGEAASLPAARQAFRVAFDAWLAWAQQHDGTVHWME